MLATYGISVGSVDYETYCGLAFNLDRVQLQNAYSVALGVGAAHSSDSLDFSWFDAVCMTSEEAERRMYLTNVARSQASSRSKWFGR